MDNQIKNINIRTYEKENAIDRTDHIAIEDPLEIQLRHPKYNMGIPRAISITMRTPGADVDLALGFLFTERIIDYKNQVVQVRQSSTNAVWVLVHEDVQIKELSLERNFYTTSSCGVCGKASIDAIRMNSMYTITSDGWTISVSQLYSLQKHLLEQQSVFGKTGGIHAAALFDSQLNILQLREDVGRHNALDKLIGHYFQHDKLPLSQHIVFLSGRASFELLQKAGMAGIPIVVAVGAPSSLAVEVAQEMGVTLIGFLKEGSFNVYTHGERIN